jgi:thiamine biosynthesis lipoprotein
MGGLLRRRDTGRDTWAIPGGADASGEPSERRGSGEDLGVTRWRLWGTSVALVVQPGELVDDAARLLRQELAVTERTCSRFRHDSELMALNRAQGASVQVSQAFFEALEQGVRAARLTDGAVDPTVATSLAALGYDRDFDELRSSPAPSLPDRQPAPAPGYQLIDLDRPSRLVRLPPGVEVDLGATAKALCADRAARKIAGATGAGVLVSLGGDVAVAGPPPPGGWPVAVVGSAKEDDAPADTLVAICDGGLASSSTAVRTWEARGRALHHIIDPRTGWPADAVWRLVSVAAGSCVDANIASTAAVVWGAGAVEHLEALGLPARLVDADGRVTLVGGWPSETPSPEPVGAW